MGKVRLGIIGFGNIGSQHAKALTNGEVPNCTLVAIADIDEKRREIAEKLYGEQLTVFSIAKELIESPLVDAIHICVPHYLHPVYGIEGLKNQKHIMVEKPSGVYTKQVRELNEEAIKHPDLVFGVMFNQRTNPIYQKVRELVVSGELGTITRTNWIITNWFRAQSYYDQSNWRATWKGEGGGVLLNQNPHNLDLFQWICGMPSRIRSQVYYGKHRDIEVEDDVYALMEYPNGATGCYITTIADSPGTNRLEICGDQGKIVVEDNTIVFHRLRESCTSFNSRFKGGIGQPECWKIEVPIKGTYTSHCGILQNFCDAILKGTALMAPGEEGIRGLEISNAIHLSSWEGGNWVDLPVDENLYYAKLQERIKNSETQ
jgi:predicted dehydrogenase